MGYKKEKKGKGIIKEKRRDMYKKDKILFPNRIREINLQKVWKGIKKCERRIKEREKNCFALYTLGKKRGGIEIFTVNCRLNEGGPVYFWFCSLLA